MKGPLEERLWKYTMHLYGNLLATDEGLARLMEEIPGKRLACFCAGKDGNPEVLPKNRPEVCHAQVLLNAAEASQQTWDRRIKRWQELYVNHPDRYHDELSEEERERLRAWVRENVAPRQVTGSHNSYFLKHVAERFFRERGDYDPYVSNPAIKGALIEAGYEPVWDDWVNMGFRIGPKPGSAWAAKTHGPRVDAPSLLYVCRWLPRLRPRAGS
jgi:hypothetical protein